MEEVAAGLDIGTSSIKLVLRGRKGVVYSAIKRHSGPADKRELPPGLLLSDVFRMLRSAAVENKNFKIKAIGLSALYPSLIVLDAQGKPLTRIMTWLDEKGGEAAGKFRKGALAASLHKRTGCPAHGSYPLWKLIWLRKNKPEIFRPAAKFLSLPDYLVYRLTGKYAVSRAIASTTGLFNIRTLEWDKKALALAGISAAQLPECFSIYHLEPILQGPRFETGLPPDAVVVLGAGDGHLCNIGAGCADGKVCSTVGASSAVRVIGPLKGYNPSVWRYYLYGDKYVSGIAANAGLSTLEWFVKDILREKSERLPRLISGLDPALTTGIVFLPFLDGERGPGYNQGMSAAFMGLRSSDGSREMFKAVLEGLFFSLYHCLEVLFGNTRKPAEITATGGYARFPGLLQLQADIFGMRVKAIDSDEASADGSAKVALTALGTISSPLAIKPGIRKIYFPDSRRQLEYKVKYAAYRKFYEMQADK
ncbi:MAG TPA: hypothetical protein DCL44_00220 [Elusimicrobia bacterium]|nr:hypothetical protein [Elusimicrobiota bacterium]